MQVNEIKAFRQRLVRAGFTHVHIYKVDPILYIYRVICNCPTGERIDVFLDIYKIINSLHSGFLIKL